MSPVSNLSNLIVATKVLPFLDDPRAFALASRSCFKHAIISSAINTDEDQWLEFAFYLRVTLPTDAKMERLSSPKIFEVFVKYVRVNLDPVANLYHRSALEKHFFSLNIWQSAFKLSTENLRKSASISPQARTVLQAYNFKKYCDEEKGRARSRVEL